MSRWKRGRCMLLHLLFGLFTRCQHSCIFVALFRWAFSIATSPWVTSTSVERTKSLWNTFSSTTDNISQKFQTIPSTWQVQPRANEHQASNARLKKTTLHPSECSRGVDRWNHWPVRQQLAMNVRRDEDCHQHHSSVHKFQQVSRLPSTDGKNMRTRHQLGLNRSRRRIQVPWPWTSWCRLHLLRQHIIACGMGPRMDQHQRCPHETAIHPGSHRSHVQSYQLLRMISPSVSTHWFDCIRPAIPINKFVAYGRNHIRSNLGELTIVKEFSTSYQPTKTIWW
jgi:hypothetical protein